MADNFTQAQGLVSPITSQGWFANPAGIEGHEVIVLEKRGDGGSRFYCSLKPGQTLSFGERVFNKFQVFSVDMRYARSFSIEGQFATRERGRKVGLKLNVRYRVTDAKVVAMDAADPLGALRDKVVATLHREVARYPEEQIDPSLIEKIVRGVGPVPDLGLIVEDAEILEFNADKRVDNTILEIENAEHTIKLDEIKRRAELKAKQEINEADIRVRQDRHTGLNLGDINVLMQEYPNLIPQVLETLASRDQRAFEAQTAMITPVIAAYIAQQRDKDEDIDPEEVANIIRRSLATNSRPQLPGTEPKQIVWGDENNKASEPERPPIKFEEEKKDQGDKRIRFGDA